MRLLDWMGRAPEGAMIAPDVQYFGEGPVILGPGIRIDTGCVLFGAVAIGARTHIAPYCLLYGKAGIVIGSEVNVGAFCVLHSESESFTGEFPMGPMWPEGVRRPYRAEVRVGRRATLGTRCTLLPGVCVGDGAIIGGHSLVPPRALIDHSTMWAGTPARFRKLVSPKQLEVPSPC